MSVQNLDTTLSYPPVYETTDSQKKKISKKLHVHFFAVKTDGKAFIPKPYKRSA